MGFHNKQSMLCAIIRLESCPGEASQILEPFNVQTDYQNIPITPATHGLIPQT